MRRIHAWTARSSGIEGIVPVGFPDLFSKAAALLHSLAAHHPLVDGNKRLAWLATYVWLAKNGVELDPDDDAAYELVIAVAAGEIDDVGEIAAVLASWRAG